MLTLAGSPTPFRIRPAASDALDVDDDGDGDALHLRVVFAPLAPTSSARATGRLAIAANAVGYRAEAVVASYVRRSKFWVVVVPHPDCDARNGARTGCLGHAAHRRLLFLFSLEAGALRAPCLCTIEILVLYGHVLLLVWLLCDFQGLYRGVSASNPVLVQRYMHMFDAGCSTYLHIQGTAFAIWPGWTVAACGAIVSARAVLRSTAGAFQVGGAASLLLLAPPMLVIVWPTLICSS